MIIIGVIIGYFSRNLITRLNNTHVQIHWIIINQIQYSFTEILQLLFWAINIIIKI